MDGEFEELRNEVARLRDEAADAERRAREIEELKARLASGTKSTAASSREFLDLREALNRKDKEILTFRELISKKERQVIETQDRSLASERAHADLEERLLTMEREIGDTREKNESLVADRELAKKASEDFRTRLEKAKADGEAKDRQIAEVRGRHAEELASAEDRFGALRAELDQTLANERAEHARALDQSEDRRKKDVDQIKRDHDAQLAGARNEWQAELSRTRVESEQREQARLDELRTSVEGGGARRAENKAANAALESEGRPGPRPRSNRRLRASSRPPRPRPRVSWRRSKRGRRPKSERRARGSRSSTRISARRGPTQTRSARRSTTSRKS